MNYRAFFCLFSAVLFLSACVQDSLSVGSGSYSSIASSAYGGQKNQKYKTYLPVSVDDTTPVVVFVSGGGWVRSDRKKYSFVGKALAKKGFITAIPGYRVYPQTQFPGFVEDVARAVADIKKNRAPGRPVFLLGHSAGAHIAAMLTYDHSYLARQGLDVCRDIAGFIGVSGPYDLTVRKGTKHSKIFPPDQQGRHMPIAFVTARTPPVLLLHGTSDRMVPSSHSQRFYSALKSSGSSAQLKSYKNVGHLAILGAFSRVVSTRANTVEDVSDFIRKNAVNSGNTCK